MKNSGEKKKNGNPKVPNDEILPPSIRERGSVTVERSTVSLTSQSSAASGSDVQGTPRVGGDVDIESPGRRTGSSKSPSSQKSENRAQGNIGDGDQQNLKE